jgi:hypothetical protein
MPSCPRGTCPVSSKSLLTCVCVYIREDLEQVPHLSHFHRWSHDSFYPYLPPTNHHSMSKSGETASGGAATAISPEGDLKLVFKLDKSWIVSPFPPFTSQSTNGISPISTDSRLSILISAISSIHQPRCGWRDDHLLGSSSNLAYITFS